VSVLSGLYLNRGQLTEPVSDGYQWAKKAGLEWRARLRPGEKVADRKPFFAFYAGARYVEIPIAPYDDALRYLADEKVRLLIVHRDTIEPLRPALTPLLFDRALIRGEVRFRQAEIDVSSYVIYEREREKDPLAKRRITERAPGLTISPNWSPDGAKIGFRRIEPSGGSSLWIVDAGGGAASRAATLSDAGAVDPISWSPDSKRIAFSALGEEGLDIQVCDPVRGTLETVVAGGGNDRSPSWSRDGGEIFFSSDRSGESEIWSVDLASGSPAKVTQAGRCAYPAPSPRGDRLAFVREGDGLVILDRASGRSRAAETPPKVTFAPAWSPDGRFIAAAAEESGGSRVYLVYADDGKALVLTKTVAGMGMPSWSPDGDRLVVAANENGDVGLWVLSGLESYKERLASTYSPRVVAKKR
jgi:dipeptidyl aminopeptidase/acylaminoacyl peptidase